MGSYSNERVEVTHTTASRWDGSFDCCPNSWQHKSPANLSLKTAYKYCLHLSFSPVFILRFQGQVYRRNTEKGTEPKFSLDSQLSGMMGRKGVISVLVIIAGLLLSNHGAKGQLSEGSPAPTAVPVHESTMASLPLESTRVGSVAGSSSTAVPVHESTMASLPLESTRVGSVAGSSSVAGAVDKSTMVPLVFELTSTVGSVSGSLSCSSFTQNRDDACSALTGLSDITDYLNYAKDLSAACSYTMLQYGCASIGGHPATTYAAILTCYLSNSMAVTSQASLTLFISQIPAPILAVTLNILNNQIPSSDISENNKKYMLNAVWGNLIANPDNLTPGFLATWTTELLYPYITSIDEVLLDCIPSSLISCDSLESFVLGLDVSYSKFDQSQKELIGSFITTFISKHSCMNANTGDFVQSFYKKFINNIEIVALYTILSVTEMESAIGDLTDFQLAQYVGLSKSFSSYETALPILQLLQIKDYNFIFNFLSTLSADNYGQEISYSLLSTALIQLNAVDDPLCKPKITTIIQAKFSYLFVGINGSILNLFVLGDCSDYQAVYGAIDGVYSSLSNDTQELLYEYRKNYLNAEVLKSGSACTYGVSSSQWFLLNLGASSSMFSYAEIIIFNFNFKGFEAIEYLSMNQFMDLIIVSGILTTEFPIDYEIHISAVITFLKTRDFEYFQLFFIQLKAYLLRINIQYIINFNVRRLFLQGVWGILELRFAQFTPNDWFIWYNNYLTICLSEITIDELSVLSNSVVKDCSNLRSIVGGLDGSFEQMDEDTKSGIANWIVSFVLNDTSRCIETEGNWLTLTFYQFRPYVSVAAMKEMNPDFDLLESLDQFSSAQIGQVVYSETAAHSNVTLIGYIFSFLIVENNMLQTIENCGHFWDGFNAARQQETRKRLQNSLRRRRRSLYQTDEFTAEVKYKLLELTTDEISMQYSTFTSEQWNLWWVNRLEFVTTEVTSDILSQIPLSISCDSYKAFVKGQSGNYDQTGETSQDAVYNFIISFFTQGTKCSDSEVSTVSFMKTSLGSYSVKLTYEQLITYYTGFNAFDTGVLATMSEDQIGDMIVVDKVYESQENCEKVFAYLQTLSVERVDNCMARFTATAIKKNIIILNFSVGQYMLQSYFTILKTSLVTYSHDQIIQLFELKIYLFIRFFSKTILQLFVVEDCDTLVVIVNQLDNGFSSMSVETQKDIASWILDLLKSSNLNGCGSISQTTSVWVASVWKSFISVISISQIKEVYSSFDVISVINRTSVSQKVDYLFSSDEYLVNVENVTVVLESMYAGDNVVTTSEIYSFCSAFNVKYEGLTVQYMSYEVQQEIFTFLFTSWIKNMNSMSTDEISQFEPNFKFFLSGVTVTALEVIPLKMGCNVYQIIFLALSNVMEQLSEEMKMAIFEAMINFLDAQSTGSSDVCGSLYTDSRTYVTNIYYGFFIYVKFYQLITYYREFDMYTVLDLCSGEQLGNLFMNSTAISDQFKAIQIFVELEKRDFSAVSSFMIECTRVAKEKDIVSLNNANMELLFYTAVWKPMSQHLNTEADFQWFSDYASLITGIIPATAIETIQAPDCNSQRLLVEAFSKAFDQQTEIQQDSVYGKIKEFNQGQKERTGSACSSGTSSEWLYSFYGRYISKASYPEFEEYNPEFSPEESLVAFSGTQVADYCIQSRGLSNESTIVTIYQSMDSIQKVEDFLMHLNEIDAVELQNSPFAYLILSNSIDVIYEEFITFSVQDWAYWFQIVLEKILSHISISNIERISFPLPCDSYQSLVKAFDNVYTQMTNETRKNIYDYCIRPQLSAAPVVNGVRCGQDILRTQDWIDINIRSFSVYGDINEYKQWNINFKSTDVIETVSPAQLGVIAVEYIAKEEVACQVAGRVQQFQVEDAKAFLVSFYAAFKTSNAKITSMETGFKFLSAAVGALKSTFDQFSSSDWEYLFSVELHFFLFSINYDILTSILGSADCSGYFVIVEYLDLSFDDFTVDTQQALAGALTAYLNTRPSGTCSMSGESSVVASALFGRFIIFIQYEDLVSYISNFDGLSAISLLSPSQQGSLAFTGDILNDESKATILGNSIQSMSFDKVDQFLTSWQATAEKNSFTAIANDQVRSIIFNSVFGVISTNFMSMSTEKWISLFQFKLNILLPSITGSQILLIPNSINCVAYQSVISGFSLQYSRLSGTAQKAIADKAKSYLSFNKPDFGPKCPPSSGGSGAWINLNLALFSDYFLITDFSSLNEGIIFTDAVGFLTAEQLGSLASSSEYLSDKDKCSKILNGISSATVGKFMDAFNAGLVENGITQISNVQVRTFFMGEIFCKLASILSFFSASDYSQWFGGRLKFFISSIDARALGFIPLDISCDSLAAIMQPLNQVENLENPDAIFAFSNSVLEAQKATTGVACTSAAVSSSEWITRYFGQCFYLASWSHVIELNPTIVLTEVKSYLTTSQLADASSTMIGNSGEMTSLVFTFNGTLEEFYAYISQLVPILNANPEFTSNTKLKEALLMMIANLVFEALDSLSIQETQNWMFTLSGLLSSINSTMLELIPERISCQKFQIIVGSCSKQYYSMVPTKRQNMADFIMAFLLNKLDKENDSCSTGPSPIDYVQKNCGYFCNQFTDENVSALKSVADPVSFVQVCKMS
ncbi:uncharacterized protein [Phyllobates terribilis]|uniref:uncharacterized protein n=1 Tax=Phyllobates terribilis TaxID=111132 RepID=UPI003CCA9B88